MGVRGPIPKREAERRRRNKDGGTVTHISSRMPDEFVPPPALAHWCELAKEWYNSLATSGQSEFYEPSDWAQARVLAEVLNDLLKGSSYTKDGKEFRRGINGQGLAAWLSGAADLLTSEGQRRRLRLELSKGGELVDDSKEKIVQLYRDRAAKTG